MTAITLTPRAEREQRAFRVLLDCMARPGSLRRLPSSNGGGANAAAISAMESLVDHEVTFGVWPERPELSDALLRQTGSRLAPLEEADFVLCDAGSLPEALLRSKDGTMEYPDHGATIVCQVSGMSAAGGPGDELVLAGPGIRDTARVWVEGFDQAARAAFAERNSQVPLGADVVLIAPSGDVCCLSRYTRVDAPSGPFAGSGASPASSAQEA